MNTPVSAPPAAEPGPPPPTVAEALAWARRALAAGASKDEAALEARMLLARPEASIGMHAWDRLRGWVARRRAGEPMAYLLGSWGFWDLELAMTPAVLVPRPETEALVELALELLGPGPATVAEVGTGSGAVALALARERPAWRLIATDLCPEALAVARENRDALGLAARVELRLGETCTPLAGERLDLLLANPPYVAEGDPCLKALRHEPRLALVAGPTGLELIERIARQARALLRPGGWLLLEHGAGQGEAVATLLQDLGYRTVLERRDLAGRPRAAAGRWEGAG